MKDDAMIGETTFAMMTRLAQVRAGQQTHADVLEALRHAINTAESLLPQQEVIGLLERHIQRLTGRRPGR